MKIKNESEDNKATYSVSFSVEVPANTDDLKIKNQINSLIEENIGDITSIIEITKVED